MATLILGAWIGCGLLMAYLILHNMQSPERVTAAPTQPAARLMQRLGQDGTRLLLRYQAMELSRNWLYVWENIQFVLGIVLLVFLQIGTQKRILPLAFCGFMLLLLGIQHFGIGSELTYRGREADFPPGNADLAIQARAWALEQMYAMLEGLKLLIGAVLAGYLLVFRASTRSVRSRSRKKVEAVDDSDHGHVDG